MSKKFKISIKIDFRLIQVVMDAVLAVLVLRPWLSDCFFGDVVVEYVGLAIWFAIPLGSLVLQMYAKESTKTNASRTCWLFTAIVLCAEVACFNFICDEKHEWNETLVALGTMTVGLLVHAFLMRLPYPKGSFKLEGSPKCVSQCIYEIFLGVAYWKAIPQIFNCPDWLAVLIPICTVIITVWLQYGDKHLKIADVIVMALVITIAVLLWQEDEWTASYPTLKFVGTLIACLLLFAMYLFMAKEFRKKATT